MISGIMTYCSDSSNKNEVFTTNIANEVFTTNIANEVFTTPLKIINKSNLYIYKEQIEAFAKKENTPDIVFVTNEHILSKDVLPINIQQPILKNEYINTTILVKDNRTSVWVGGNMFYANKSTKNFKIKEIRTISSNQVFMDINFPNKIDNLLFLLNDLNYNVRINGFDYEICDEYKRFFTHLMSDVYNMKEDIYQTIQLYKQNQKESQQNQKEFKQNQKESQQNQEEFKQNQ